MDAPAPIVGGAENASAGPAVPPAEGDAVLVEALRRGDAAVYADLVDRLYPGMLRLALAHTGDRDLADDVIQETWIAVVDGIDRFEGRASLRTWIHRILQNLARRHAGRERRFVAVGDLPDARFGALRAGGDGRPDLGHLPAMERWGPRQTPEDWVLAREVVAQVEAAIQALPRNQRAVITLRDVEGWSSKEVCDLLEISPANQRVLLHRARSAVRQAIRPYVGATEDG